LDRPGSKSEFRRGVGNRPPLETKVSLDARLVPERGMKKYRWLIPILALGVAMAIPPLAVSAPVEAQSTPRVQFIGMASMSDDGTVTLRLTMTSDGKPADAIIIYKAEDPRYNEVLRHLGGLKPGQIKPVPSWE
jgi:hypothetical protein